MEELVRTQKETRWARGTHSLETIEPGGLVRIREESDRGRGTHFLETTKGGTCHGHGKKPTERGALTN